MNQPASPRQTLASNVLAVIIRVAGPVITEVRPHAVGYPERQVCVRLGDALLYLTDPNAAARIRERWDGAQNLAARLPEQVSQTWLAHDPDFYPLGVILQLNGDVKADIQWISARQSTRTPAHLRIRVERIVWQICDREAWRAIGDALFDAQRYLQQEQRPARLWTTNPAVHSWGQGCRHTTRSSASLGPMTTFSWEISAIGHLPALRAGTAHTLADTWTAALRAGRTALLSGELNDLAISIDGRLEAQHSPGRRDGALDPAQVTESLLEIHQAATAHVISDLIAKPPDQT